MAWWDSLADWGAADWTRDPAAAHFRYVSHLGDMQMKKNWPPQMVTQLTVKSKSASDQTDNGETYWRTIANNEAEWMRAAGVEPGELEKIDSHLLFIQSTGQAAESLQQAIAEYSPMNVAKEVAKQTAADIAEKADEVTDPFQSKWPWIAAGVVGLILVLKFK